MSGSVETKNGSIRRVLSISGGGIKGVFCASFLTEVEDALKSPVVSHFDLVVGTSTGGIIALALGLGISARDILAFYEEFGTEIFRKSLLNRITLGWFVSKYDPAALRAAVERMFGNRTVGESRTRLVIPSLSLENGEVHVFKTSHAARLERDWKMKAADVAMATSAAPTYFPAHRGIRGLPLVDGGVWANNPVGAAAVEAVGLLGWKKGHVKILSLECPGESLDVGLGRSIRMGKLYWAYRISDTFMAAQASASVGTAQQLLGHENVVRIAPISVAGRYSLDRITGIESLRGLGYDEARRALPRLREVFLREAAEEFVPLHK